MALWWPVLAASRASSRFLLTAGLHVARGRPRCPASDVVDLSMGINGPNCLAQLHLQYCRIDYLWPKLAWPARLFEMQGHAPPLAQCSSGGPPFWIDCIGSSSGQSSQSVSHLGCHLFMQFRRLRTSVVVVVLDFYQPCITVVDAQEVNSLRTTGETTELISEERPIVVVASFAAFVELKLHIAFAQSSHNISSIARYLSDCSRSSSSSTSGSMFVKSSAC